MHMMFRFVLALPTHVWYHMDSMMFIFLSVWVRCLIKSKLKKRKQIFLKQYAFQTKSSSAVDESLKKTAGQSWRGRQGWGALSVHRQIPVPPPVCLFGGPASELRSGGNSREQERAVFLWAWEEVQASIGRDLGAEEERGRRRWTGWSSNLFHTSHLSLYLFRKS